MKSRQNIIANIDRVSKIYGKGRTSVIAINSINLHVIHGELLVVMGPSGSGKSTLIQLIGGLLSPSTGQIFIRNNSLQKMNSRRLANFRLKEIGFVFQNANLLGNLTASENVELPLNLAGWKRNKARKRAMKLLERVGLTQRSYHKPKELSGGEQQRVSIARALANDPVIILADEPTGHLDRENGKMIIQLIRSIQKEDNKTVIIVTHDTMILEVADRRILLEDGMITLENYESSNIDPICLMKVDTKSERFIILDQIRINFCSLSCFEKFKDRQKIHNGT